MDGDNVRDGFNRNLALTDADRTILSIRLSSTKGSIGITQVASVRVLEHSIASLFRFYRLMIQSIMIDTVKYISIL
ncbi:adenylyl-sulfate kinase [Sphingobium sp. OAS761]|uniref:adenylyl-sulfate kinase n=1 Tax=Sphingobium sp. OAS761 TaxID=2817901 RepID=UPI00346053DE